VLRDQAAEAGDPARWEKARDAAHALERLTADARDIETRNRVGTLVQEVTLAAATAEADRKLLQDLIDIRSAKADDAQGTETDASYGSAFHEAGLDLTKALDRAGAIIRAKPAAVAQALAAALDNWAAVRRDLRRDRPGAQRLVQVARAADHDPWRNRLRDALETPDKTSRLQALEGLAKGSNAEELAPISLDLLGSALLDALAFQTAERVLRAAQRRYPGDVWLNYNLARCLEKLGRRGEAIRYYTSARSIQPETAHELAEALERTGELDESIAVFRDLKRLRPYNGRHLGCLARALKKHGETKEAAALLELTVTMLKDRIHVRPGDSAVHYQLGCALEQQGKPEEALEEFRISQRLEPDTVAALSHICDILIKKGKSEEADAFAREMLRIKPDALAHGARGISLQALGKLDEAVAEYRIAVEMDPASHAIHENFGTALSAHGKIKEAIAEYRAAIELDQTCPYAHQQLAGVLSGQGKLAEATDECRTAIRLEPASAYSHQQLAGILYDHGKLAEASDEYRTAIRLEPAGAYAHEQLAAILSAHGKLAEAKDEYRTALRLEPDKAWAHNQFAWALVRSPGRPRHDYDEASSFRGRPSSWRRRKETTSTRWPWRSIAWATGASRSPLASGRWPWGTAVPPSTGFSWHWRTGRRAKRTRPAPGSTRRLPGRKRKTPGTRSFASSGRRRPSCCASRVLAWPTLAQLPVPRRRNRLDPSPPTTRVRIRRPHVEILIFSYIGSPEYR
jgi:tetratricopeptide (TPR) repeat protein